MNGHYPGIKAGHPRPVNWYAVWSATVALMCGAGVFLAADPYGFVWRSKLAQVENLKRELAIARKQGAHWATIVTACRNGKSFSFNSHLVFCDPQSAPVTGDKERYYAELH